MTPDKRVEVEYEGKLYKVTEVLIEMPDYAVPQRKDVSKVKFTLTQELQKAQKEHRHNKITAEYQKVIDNLHEQLNRKEKLESILDKLVDKTNTIAGSMDGYVSSANIMDSLDDTIPRYVHDVNGGKVIRQEATPVTILDADGKATYGYTKEKPDKGYRYQLKRK